MARPPSRRPGPALALAALLAAGAALGGAAGCSFEPDGTCAAAADCLAGERCEAGLCLGCLDASECAGWETCTPAHRCATAPGRCTEDAACGAWQGCAPDHTCQALLGYCDDAGACAPGQVCGPDHRCAAGP